MVVKKRKNIFLILHIIEQIKIISLFLQFKQIRRTVKTVIRTIV